MLLPCQDSPKISSGVYIEFILWFLISVGFQGFPKIPWCNSPEISLGDFSRTTPSVSGGTTVEMWRETPR